MKWVKRFLLAVAILLIVILTMAVVALRSVRTIPAWYRPTLMNAEQREAAAQRATNKFAIVQNAAAAAHAREIDSPTTHPNAITISLTDDEMNAFFQKWSVLQEVRSSYDQFLSDPAIALQDGRIILAGRVKQIDAIASVYLEARIDEQGKLDLQLARIYVGTLHVPAAIVRSYQKQAAKQIEQDLQQWRRGAEISVRGTPNSYMVSAVMGQLLVDVLNQQSADAVMFLPLVERGSIPVKVLSVRIEGHTLTLVVEPMTAGERKDLVERLRSGGTAP